MKITSKQISDIAQELQSVINIFINRKDLEIRSILDYENLYGDSEFWEEELEKIASEWIDYVIITKMESRDAFKIMEEFIDEIKSENFRNNLIKILNRKSPFANFKAEIETSSYRNKWFEFQKRKYEDYVREQLKIENINTE